MFRALLALVFVLAIALAAGLYVAAGRAPGPTVEILEPTRLVGRSAVFEAAIESPQAELVALEATIEQDASVFSLFSLDRPADAEVRQEGPDRIRIRRAFDRQSHPALHAGAARVRVSATRPVLFGLRERSTSVVVDVEVRLDPPRLSVESTFHYVNHGGSEVVVYRVTPADASSGVRVGDREYPGYSAAGPPSAGDGELRIAFFALSYDQDLQTPIELYARDEAGNKARADFDHRRFPKTFRRSRIELSDNFLRRVVPAIVDRVPELADERPDGSDEEWLDLYLFINGELRRRNRDLLVALSADTSPRMLWDGAFRQLTNSQVESGFADHRTYVHEGDDVDQQVHLGFDLASTANAPILAANTGRVVYADYLGIFGNCVVVDHGMGLQTLYAHLSSIAVSLDDPVQQGQQIGLSGQTGLAGGDHLHYATLLHGRPVSPVEWWDPHWIEDRVVRKLKAASIDDAR